MRKIEKKYDEALELLKKYNHEDFHIQHGVTVGACMKYFANLLGHGEEADYWELVGLLHDIDFEMYPEEHCHKCVELLESEGYDIEFIRSIQAHGYGMVCDVEPQHLMEKVLYTVDELTGIIGAYALMRPNKSTEGMEVKSLKKKFKDKKFAGGCDREVIKKGAENLGWEMDYLFENTIAAMQEYEARFPQQ